MSLVAGFPVETDLCLLVRYNRCIYSDKTAFRRIRDGKTTIMEPQTASTVDELEMDLGGRLRAYRLMRNIDQATLAARAGVGVSALRSLEAGRGSTVRTLLAVVRALGRQEWLNTVAPVPTVNPLALPSHGQQRERARRRRPAAQRNTQD